MNLSLRYLRRMSALLYFKAGMAFGPKQQPVSGLCQKSLANSWEAFLERVFAVSFPPVCFPGICDV